MNRFVWVSILVVVIVSIIAAIDSVELHSAGQTLITSRDEAIQRLESAIAGRGVTKRNRATGLVDFVRLDPGTPGSLIQTNVSTSRVEKSLAFVSERKQAFGLLNPNQELKFAKEQRDLQGGAHLTFDQIYNGVPVFAAVLKTHFNAAGELRAVNGVTIPDIQLSTIPTRTAAEAAAFALANVQHENPNVSGITSAGAKLYLYRTGLAQGVLGENHLVWEISVSNKSDLVELVYVDAHSGKLVDRVVATYEALDRRVYDGQNLDAFPPPNFPSNPFWIEGQPFPTNVENADEVIFSCKETYDLFKNGFGRDSFDDAGLAMLAIYDSGFASGGTFAIPFQHLVSISKDFSSDDIIPHELTHIYTYQTAGLIYQWQPGAINEAYSDIFGETVDLMNGRGLDIGGSRQADDCSRSIPKLHVNSPSYLQGDYPIGLALFGPSFSQSGITGKVVLIDDGVGAITDGCQTPYRNAKEINGNIALIDESAVGTCTYAEQVKIAQLNGARAVIVARSLAFDGEPLVMFGLDPAITIPSGIIGYYDGQVFRAPRAKVVNATVTGSPASTSNRWAVGEQTAYRGIRDMWNPRCYTNPGKVSDLEYYCRTTDQGGVHQNSGIPNHGYALLVDGGTYNNQTIAPLGLTKAAHIYFRALASYLTPSSNFADLAEALETSAADLVGVNLPALESGLPSGESISTFDLEQVHKMTLAVELRDPPTQCRFQPILAKTPPPDNCVAPQNKQVTIFSDDFESDPASQWLISRDVASTATFIPRDWVWVHELPDGVGGSGFFAPDPFTDCFSAVPGQVGVLHLDSPIIELPRVMSGGPHLSFDHYVLTERGFDGGQLLISVNGGRFKLVGPINFIYNPYNLQLFTAPPGFEEVVNPRGGQPAFSGTDDGSVNGSWGKSIVDLSLYAHPGDRIRLRWDLSTDYCFGTDSGWYLDNVRVYACRP